MLKLHQILITSIRQYQRPSKAKIASKIPKGFQNSFDKNWNPFAPNGSIQHFNLWKLTAFIALVNLNLWEMYKNYSAYCKGEETSADQWYDRCGLDVGFRSKSAGRDPLCGADCFFKAYENK